VKIAPIIPTLSPAETTARLALLGLPPVSPDPVLLEPEPEPEPEVEFVALLCWASCWNAVNVLGPEAGGFIPKTIPD